MSPASLATATTRGIAVSVRPRRRAASSPPAAARLAKSGPRSVPTRAKAHSGRAARWKREPSRDARGARAASADQRSGGARVSSQEGSRPHPDAANASRLLGLLRANAYVELVGSAAVAFRPDAVFPEISSSAAGAECARWYALALAAFALASFACGGAASVAATRELDDGASVRTLKTTCFPVVASMALYHSGVSRFAASAVARGAASPALRGAIAVHAPLALAFALATVFCVRAGAGRSEKRET